MTSPHTNRSVVNHVVCATSCWSNGQMMPGTFRGLFAKRCGRNSTTLTLVAIQWGPPSTSRPTHMGSSSLVRPTTPHMLEWGSLMRLPKWPIFVSLMTGGQLVFFALLLCCQKVPIFMGDSNMHPPPRGDGFLQRVRKGSRAPQNFGGGGAGKRAPLTGTVGPLQTGSDLSLVHASSFWG